MVFFVIILLIFALETCVKRHMDRVRTLEEQRRLAGGRIILKKYYNTGAAGNFLAHYPQAMQCIHGAVLGAAAAELARLLPEKNTGMACLGLSFAAGGGLSNLYDRLTKGHVVDYVSFGFGPQRFRRFVFNLADFFIIAGAFLLAVFILFQKGGSAWKHKR